MFPQTCVLLAIDLQDAMRDPRWGRRNNPRAEENAARLQDAFRKTNRRVIHVKHVSKDPDSAFRPGQPGAEFQELTAPRDGETVIEKRNPSAFAGTGLDEVLRWGGHCEIVVTGVITNNSVEATVRAAAALGFTVYVVSDAAYTVDRRALDGTVHAAEDVHMHALSNMSGEYAAVVTADEVIAGLVL